MRRVLAFGSLFSGAGGLDLGLERAGLRCLWRCESDPDARKVLARHWPDDPLYDDARTLDGRRIERPDLLCGGDPCQANSRAGAVHRRRRESPADHFLRLADEIRPRLVLRENPAAVRADAPWPWFRFRAGLESLGYAVLPFRLRACCVGADHRRERLFLLGALPDADGHRLEGLDGPGLAARDAGGGRGDRGGDDRRHDLPGPRFRRSSDGTTPGMVRPRLTMAGNAVDVRVGEFIGRLLIEAAGVTD